MTFNQTIIQKHAEQYKKLFKEQHGVNPTSWFSYFKWLSTFTTAGSFTHKDSIYAMELLGVE